MAIMQWYCYKVISLLYVALYNKWITVSLKTHIKSAHGYFFISNPKNAGKTLPACYWV